MDAYSCKKEIFITTKASITCAHMTKCTKTGTHIQHPINKCSSNEFQLAIFFLMNKSYLLYFQEKKLSYQSEINLQSFTWIALVDSIYNKRIPMYHSNRSDIQSVANPDNFSLKKRKKTKEDFIRSFQYVQVIQVDMKMLQWWLRRVWKEMYPEAWKNHSVSSAHILQERKNLRVENSECGMKYGIHFLLPF